MPMLFHYLVDSVDFLGHRATREMIVIAGGEEEARQEVAAYFQMHREVEQWAVVAVLETRQLPPDDPYARQYGCEGAHSFILP